MTAYTLLPATSTTGLMGFNVVTDEISFVATLFLFFVTMVVTTGVFFSIFEYHFYMVYVYDNEKFKNHEKIKKLYKKKMRRAMFMGLFVYAFMAIMYFIDQTIINPAFLETITNFMS